MVNTVIAQQLDGDIFLPAIQFILIDTVIIAMIAMALLLRLVDRAKIRIISVLCLTAMIGFSILMATLGREFIDSWNTTFYTVHAGAMATAIALLIESTYKAKRGMLQDSESSASASIA